MKILLCNYSYCHVDKIELFEDDEELYDIDVEEDHSFLLDGGYVVHNSAGGCFVGETEISLVDNRSISFKEIIKEQKKGIRHFTYTIKKDGHIGVEEIINPRITRKKANVIKVHLDNGESIICTPDHKFMLVDGSYKEAKDLNPEDSLMPLYRKFSSQEMKEYELVRDHKITHIEQTKKLYDVYDIEIPNTHNFALKSGVFVHNSAKQGRNNRFQAILPLRGKVLNVEKTSINKAMENKEIQALISALNVTPQANGVVPDSDDLRFHNIILMCHTGDTKIPLLNGQTKTIKELAEQETNGFWVYSIDEQTGKAKPGFAYLPRKTGEVQDLIEIEFDDGSKTRCTLDHKWVRKNGKIVKAKNLKPNDSLLSIHRKISKKGYEQIFDPTCTRSNKWINTHTIIARESFPEYEKICSDICKKHPKKTYPVVHHKDFNKQNNEPSNLMWQEKFNHIKMHKELGRKNLTKYNKSQKHKDRIKELSQQGHYSHCHWGNQYNGSIAHLEAVKKAWEDERKRNQMLSGFKSYQGSLKNRETASLRNKKMWKDPIYREHMCSVLKKIAIEQAKEISKRTTKQWQQPEMKEKMIKGKVLKLLNRLLVNGVNIHELQEQFNNKKAQNTMRFESAVKKWGKEALIEEAKCYNRSIVKITKIHLEKPEPVYNLTVAGTHNYMLENGVISKNCDADPDGAHISCLLMSFFYKFMRTLIERGHVKIAQPPLYKVTRNKKIYYLQNDEELEAFQAKYKSSSDNIEINRFKGLGEMNPEQLAETVLNPKSRNLIQISIEDAERAAQTIDDLFGKDSLGRKRFLSKDLKISLPAFES